MSDEELLTQDEKDTLLKGVSEDHLKRKGGSSADGEISSYDFKHPAHKLKAHLPLLEVANQNFREKFAIELGSLMRQPVEVSVESFTMCKFEEYSHGLGEGVSINRVKLDPLPGTSLMCLDANLVFTLVDRFFGGSGGADLNNYVRRRFTHTETRLIEHTVEAAFRSLASSWESIFNIKPEFVRSEINAQLTSSANPAEVLVTSKFKVEFSKGSGEFHIAIPYNSLEPIKPLLKSAVDKPREGDQQWSKDFSDVVFDSPLEIQGLISETPISLRDLLNLKEGDFIPLSNNHLATFFSEQIPLFKAEIGATNGMISAKVT